MEEQIPEAWVGHEVTVYFGQAQHKDVGTLVSVSEKGIVVRHMQADFEEVYWYPNSSVTRLLHGRSPY